MQPPQFHVATLNARELTLPSSEPQHQRHARQGRVILSHFRKETPPS